MSSITSVNKITFDEMSQGVNNNYSNAGDQVDRLSDEAILREWESKKRPDMRSVDWKEFAFILELKIINLEDGKENNTKLVDLKKRMEIIEKKWTEEIIKEISN